MRLWKKKSAARKEIYFNKNGIGSKRASSLYCKLPQLKVDQTSLIQKHKIIKIITSLYLGRKKKARWVEAQAMMANLQL